MDRKKPTPPPAKEKKSPPPSDKAKPASRPFESKFPLSPVRGKSDNSSPIAAHKNRRAT